MKKKLLFLTILFIAMVFIGMPKVEAAFISTPNELASYLNATIDGSTITLTGNKTIGDADDFMILYDCTIDLNGHTLTYEMNMGNPFRIHSNVTIKNGTINGVVHYWKTLTIENAILTDITGRAESFTIVKGNSSINNEILGNITIENGATLIIDSNDFRFGYHSYNNNGHLLTNNGTIIIKDSNSVFTIDSGNNILNNGIILNYGGTFTNNGTLSSSSTGRIVNNPRKIEKLAMTNGTIDAFYYVGENDTATLKMMPNTGYRFKNGTLKVMNGQSEVQLTKVNDTTYTFTMPSADVTVFAEFELIPTYTITVNDENHFIAAPASSIGIEEGNSSTITIIPDTGYRIKSAKIDGVPQTLPLTNNKIILTNVRQNHVIDVEVEKIPYTITVNNVEGTTINPNGVIDVVYGDNKEITIKANVGYKLKSVKVNDIPQTLPLTNNKVTLTNIQENKTITVVVEKIPYTTTINNITGGTITADKLSATINDIVTLTVAPDTYYKLKNITGITMTKVNDTTYTFTMPSENVTIDAEFELIPTMYTITVNDENHFIAAPSSSISIEEGNSSTITIIPDTGYRIKSARIDGVPQTLPLTNNKIILTNVRQNHVIDVEVEKIPYTITVNNVEGATINPNGVIDVVYGDNKDITIKANAGYKLKSVKVNDIPQTLPLTNNKVTLTNIQENKTITVVVEKIPYTITINNTIGGTITADKLSATINDIVTLTVAPDAYYKLKNITGITMTKVNDTTYTFTMPSENVTIDAEYELIFEEKTITKTVGDLTVGIKGTFSQNPEIVITKIEKGNSGYDSLITLVKEDKTVIGSYDISLAGGTYKGELELTFTVGKQYEGDTITIYHKKANGEIETKTAIVKDGKAVITVNELSPFMLATDKETVAKKDETPKTGISTYIGITVFVTGLAGVGAITLKKKKCN